MTRVALLSMVERFSERHLDAAAELLAERHRRHREAEPLLADVNDFAARIGAGDGFVAVVKGRIAGYVIAGVHPQLGSMHVGSAGHAASDPEVVRDLYAAAAAGWVESGHMRHTVNVPATDTGLLDAWFRLGFGQQQAYAIREVAPEAPMYGVAIREAGVDDAVSLDRVLPDHQNLSPTFAAVPVQSDEETRADWEETLRDLAAACFLAERDGRPVGLILLTTVERDFVDSGTNVDLTFAVTVPDARGSGVGRGLTAHALTWAHEHGFRTMTTDWRVTNLLSSRFWPRRGFRPTFVRLYRSIP